MKIKSNYLIDLFFSLSIFAVFAISAILVVFFGIRVYENTMVNMNHNFTSRTAVSYITEKLRQRDVEGCVTLTEIDGTDAISLLKQEDDKTEYTYVYSYDGYLMELTATGDEVPQLNMGTRLMELRSFYVRQIATGIYYVTVTEKDGTDSHAYISTKCNQKIKGQAIAAPEE